MTVVLLGDKAVEGTSRIDLKDANGKMIVQEFIELAKKDGFGFSEYYYPKKGETEALPKRAYVQLDSNFGWIIGTGNYIDDIDKAVAEASSQAMKELRAKILLTLIISTLITLAGIAAAIITSASISKPIVKITKLINQTAELDMTFEDSFSEIYKYKDETGVMAHAVAGLRENLRNLVKMLHDDSVSLSEASQHLSHISNSVSDSIVAVASAVSETAQGAQSQAENAQESTEKLHNLSQEIERTVENSSNLQELTKIANEKSRHGSGQVRSLNTEFEKVEQITGELEHNVIRLSDKSSEISSIVSTIQSIAEQTSTSTHKIESIIQEIVEEINATKSNMTTSIHSVSAAAGNVHTAKEAFDIIDAALVDTFENLNDIISRVNAINASKDSVMFSVQNISAVTEESAAAAEEVSATMDDQKQLVKDMQIRTQTLSSMAEKLEKEISRFKY